MKKIILILFLTLMTGSMLYSQNLINPWKVVDRGGGKSNGGGKALSSSLGQTATLRATGTQFEHEAGYLAGVRARSRVSLPLSLNEGWNMISAPLTVNDYSKTTLFPNAVSDAFYFLRGYEIADTLKPGMGYWLKFDSAQTIVTQGVSRTEDSVTVTPGWNIIGSISTPVPTSAIMSIPPGLITSPFFGYNNSYSMATTVVPGKAYWIKVNAGGKLILSSTLLGSSSNKIKIVPTDELPPPPPDGEVTTATPQLPDHFALEQNYPNPFNPASVIRYQLPINGNVTLRIYNVLGEEVGILVDGYQDAGYKSVIWDASNVASGIYFYKLNAGNFIQVKRMMVIK